MAKPTDLVQGTLDLLILRTLALQPMHGWGIAQRIRQVSNQVLQVHQGALYPALHRLEQQGWIRAKWGESENNRRAKYYSLTPDGAKYLRQEQAQNGSACQTGGRSRDGNGQLSPINDGAWRSTNSERAQKLVVALRPRLSSSGCFSSFLASPVAVA